ncbi:LysR family transcriptional regulator [Aestuariibacter sp. AA17]|uniref:LysR family transcriptional regulator n=1 Tax=Fluctibacter corallii TaxID=2984329 RepID=A0ABT3A8P5_9ALTE|nr:LysR family transcriptional regulator [Aestuariibacter sp. AA17]MCV2885041.1 LysR family transcriptional regulator [Aestuariibacter sp. AA17]
MKRTLPPLNALRAFESAGRLGSFSKAALELHVTNSAISKQIKSIESYLNKVLFIRNAGSVRLTSDGEKYLYEISSVLDSLSHATKACKFSRDNKDILSVWTSPSFASLWLLPKLSDFLDSNEGTHVAVRTEENSFPINTSVDCEIRSFKKEKAPKRAILLKEEVLWLVGSNSLSLSGSVDVAGHAQKFTAATYLLNRPNAWQKATKQLFPQKLNIFFVSGVEQFFLALQQAKNNLGVCLIPDFMAKQAIQQKEVIRLTDVSVITGYCYYWMTPSYTFPISKVQRFYQWIKENLSEIKC